MVLTDRGCEIDDILSIERFLDGRKRRNIHYTNPQRLDQKGAAEKNHVELHKIMPKGTSIDGLCLDQRIMSDICSHANSSIWLSIGNTSPAALAKLSPSESLLEGLGIDVVGPRRRR